MNDKTGGMGYWHRILRKTAGIDSKRASGRGRQIGLITLVVVHVYFAIRPEKLPITASMVVGSMSREFYLKEHDPKRWVVESLSDGRRGLADGD